jgi:hypothetical protein
MKASDELGPLRAFVSVGRKKDCQGEDDQDQWQSEEDQTQLPSDALTPHGHERE